MLFSSGKTFALKRIQHDEFCPLTSTISDQTRNCAVCFESIPVCASLNSIVISLFSLCTHVYEVPMQMTDQWNKRKQNKQKKHFEQQKPKAITWHTQHGLYNSLQLWQDCVFRNNSFIEPSNAPIGPDGWSKQNKAVESVEFCLRLSCSYTNTSNSRRQIHTNKSQRHSVVLWRDTLTVWPTKMCVSERSWEQNNMNGWMEPKYMTKTMSDMKTCLFDGCGQTPVTESDQRVSRAPSWSLVEQGTVCISVVDNRMTGESWIVTWWLVQQDPMQINWQSD